mgnify:CR=1 FL=1
MLLCDVVARVWPERGLDGLAGKPLVQVREVAGGATLVALDLVEAGVGSRVLVVTGAPARDIAGGLPVDAVVTAIATADKGK